MESRTGRLQSFFPKEWFEEPDGASGWIRFYNALFIPRDNFISTMEAFFSVLASSMLGNETPVFFACGNANDFKVPRMATMMYAEPSGRLCVDMKVDEKPLPDTNYILLGTPFKDKNLRPDESKTKHHLDTVVATVCLHTGQNLMRELVYECEVHLKDGKCSVAGQGMKMPFPAEGPFLATQNASDAGELLVCITGLPEPRRGRIRLALQLVDTAMRSHYGFFEYWTALEVLCDGTSGKIQTKLAQLYGINSHAFAAKESGLYALSRWRHDFFHKGIRPTMSADVERHIQLLFLDLLRAELKLPLRGHLASLLNAPGYDLTPLGLHDNRSDEQKVPLAANPPV